MYFIYGNEDYLIEKKIQEIINNNANSRVFYFNSDIKFNDVINNISSFSLFESKKILIFKDFSFFTTTKINEIELLINSLKYKLDDTKIIFVFSGAKIPKKNKFIEYLENNSKIIECLELTNNKIISLANERIINSGGSISDIDLFYMLSKMPNKLSIIFAEIEKLLAFDKNITRNNIDEFIQRYDQSNAFDFINSFHDGNTELLFKTYYEKINQGESIQSMIGQIGSVLELCSRIYSLKKANFSLKDIEKKLNKHTFVIKKNNEFLIEIGYEKICKYLNWISKLDADIKKGLVDEKIGFERFLLETIRND